MDEKSFHRSLLEEDLRDYVQIADSKGMDVGFYRSLLLSLQDVPTPDLNLAVRRLKDLVRSTS